MKSAELRIIKCRPSSEHNVVNYFLKNYSYFYTKVIYKSPSFIRLRFHEIFKKRSFNKLKHKNLWKCRSRKLECFLTKNVNPLHCYEIHCLLSSQNKQPVTSSQKWREIWKLESSISMSLEVSSFGKTRIAVNLHFIEDFDRICIAERIYRFCFGYEIQRDWKKRRWVWRS